jgi:hypothetical protein
MFFTQPLEIGQAMRYSIHVLFEHLSFSFEFLRDQAKIMWNWRFIYYVSEPNRAKLGVLIELGREELSVKYLFTDFALMMKIAFI